jgi:hypothetical protein
MIEFNRDIGFRFIQENTTKRILLVAVQQLQTIMNLLMKCSTFFVSLVWFSNFILLSISTRLLANSTSCKTEIVKPS